LGVPFGSFVDIPSHFGREEAFLSQTGKILKFHIIETAALI